VRSKAKLVVSAGVILATCIVWAAVHQSSSDIYFRYRGNGYKVLSWERQYGTNFVLATDYKIKQWGRRQLDKVGIHLDGSRKDWIPFNKPLPGGATNTCFIKVVCRGDVSKLPRYGQGAEVVQYLDELGKVLIVAGPGIRSGPGKRIYFYWNYDVGQYPSVRQFRIVRWSDGQELLSLRF
jgi:hypothetical protein